jgi:hypothetical protein
MAGNYRHISEQQKRLFLTMSLRGMTASCTALPKMVVDNQTQAQQEKMRTCLGFRI